MPRRTHVVEHHPHHLADECFENLFRRGARGSFELRRLPPRAVGQFHGLDVERLFVAEVVIDRCDIQARFAANFADRGSFEPFFGKDLAGRVEEEVLRIPSVFHDAPIKSVVLNDCLNRLYESDSKESRGSRGPSAIARFFASSREPASSTLPVATMPSY